jgi:hypothetical protein
MTPTTTVIAMDSPNDGRCVDGRSCSLPAMQGAFHEWRCPDCRRLWKVTGQPEYGAAAWVLDDAGTGYKLRK